MPHIYSYERRGLTFWAIDVWVKTPTGSKRVREREIPTKEQAKARLAQAYTDAYEGRTFKKAKPNTLTVAKAWQNYEPVAKRNDSWKSDRSRSAHLLEHLGRRIAAELHQGDVDAYRALRQAEGTNRKDPKGKPLPPSPASMDREVELLKRVLGYAVKCGKLQTNPLAGVELLQVPNVRDVVVSDEDFERIIGALKKRSEWMRPVLLTAYDTGMRIGEVCKLHLKRVDFKAGAIRLTPQETKAELGRVVALQTRTLEALRAMPRRLGCPFLFPARRGYDPQDPKPVSIPRGGLKTALKAVGLENVHPHDLRRSYATLARRRGIPESVVMKQGGWLTPSVFKRYNIVSEQDVLDAARRMEQGRAPAVPAANTQPKPTSGRRKS